jgi:hypothetical protein
MTTYLVAAVACWLAWAKARHDTGIARLAAILGVLETALFLDIAFDWRWKLYSLLKDQAITHRLYDLRQGPQILALAVLCGLFLIAGGFALREFRVQKWKMLAAEGALFSLACWFTELISLHAMDSVLYHPAGALMVINYVWIPGCMMTAVGILGASFSVGRGPSANKL